MKATKQWPIYRVRVIKPGYGLVASWKVATLDKSKCYDFAREWCERWRIIGYTTQVKLLGEMIYVMNS